MPDGAEPPSRPDASPRIRDGGNDTLQFAFTKEDAIGRAGKTTLAKRDREKALQMQRKEKDARRELRKAEKRGRGAASNGEDPDLAGLSWGPQAPLY